MPFTSRDDCDGGHSVDGMSVGTVKQIGGASHVSSAATIEIIEQPKKETPSLVPAKPQPQPQATSLGLVDRYPMLVVGIAAFIALSAAVGMIGSIVLWLSLRHSGVMAP